MYAVISGRSLLRTPILVLRFPSSLPFFVLEDARAQRLVCAQLELVVVEACSFSIAFRGAWRTVFAEDERRAKGSSSLVHGLAREGGVPSSGVLNLAWIWSRPSNSTQELAYISRPRMDGRTSHYGHCLPSVYFHSHNFGGADILFLSMGGVRRINKTTVGKGTGNAFASFSVPNTQVGSVINTRKPT